MKGFLLRFLVSILALWLTGMIASSIGLRIQVESFAGALVAVLFLSIVNATIAPVLRLITKPLSCMTLGLFGVILNALLFWMVGSGIIPGFQVLGFRAALFGSLVMGLLNGVLYSLLDTKKER